MGEATGDCHGWGDGFGLRAGLRVANHYLHRLREPPRLGTLSTAHAHASTLQCAYRVGRGISSTGHRDRPWDHPESVVESKTCFRNETVLHETSRLGHVMLHA
jgi:hypothetical protein